MNASARILIVDDHASVRDGIRAFLEANTSFKICGEAGNGTEALQQAKSLKPDLLILDLALPQLNGVEVASILRGDLPKVKIVAFSIYANELGRAISAATKIDAVLPKSCSLRMLVETIHKLLDIHPFVGPTQAGSPQTALPGE